MASGAHTLQPADGMLKPAVEDPEMMKSVLIAAFAIALTGGTAQASEGPWRVGSTYVVDIKDLDLSKAEDRARMLKAIETAADRACRPLQAPVRRAACQRQAIESTVAKSSASNRAAIEMARAERG